MASPLDFATLNDVRTYLVTQSKGSTYDEGLLAPLITDVSRSLCSWVNRDMVQKAYNEPRNGNGGVALVLRNWPVTQVTQLVIDDRIVPPRPTVTPSQGGQTVSCGWGGAGALAGWMLDPPRVLYVKGCRFTSGIQNVLVSYTAGYVTPGMKASDDSLTVTLPEDLQLACMKTVALRYRERPRLGEVASAVGGGTTSYSQKDFPADVLTVLQSYMNVGMTP